MRNDLFFETLSAFSDKGDYLETIEKCNVALKDDPNNTIILKIKAESAVKLGKIPAFSTVLDCTQKILKQKENDIDTMILRIKALRHLEREREAKMWLEIAENLAPDNPNVLLTRSSILIDQNRIGEAKQKLKQLEEISPESAYNNLGIIAWNTKLHDNALSYFTNRLEEHPDDSTAVQNKCWLLFELKRYEDAINIIKNFIDKFGEINYQMYRILAVLYLKIAKDLDKACYSEFGNQPIEPGELFLDESDKRLHDPKFQNTQKRTEYLKKSTEIFDIIENKKIHNPLTKYWEAIMYITIEKYDRALTAIDESLQEEQNWNILSYKAFVLKQQGNYDEAIKISNQILKDNPNEKVALTTKIDSLYWSGDLLEYRRLYLKYFEAQKKEPKLPGQTKTIDRFEISINPGEHFTNEVLVIDLLASLKQNMWFLDPYFSPKWFSWIRQALERTDDIKEIRVIMGLNGLKSSTSDPITKLDDHRKLIKKFNAQYKDKISLTFAIHKNLKNQQNSGRIHDRFLFSQDNEWNIASADTITQSDRTDIQKISNPKTIKNDIERFKKLWSDENYKITGGNDDYNKVIGLLKTNDN